MIAQNGKGTTTVRQFSLFAKGDQLLNKFARFLGFWQGHAMWLYANFDCGLIYFRRHRVSYYSFFLTFFISIFIPRCRPMTFKRSLISVKDFLPKLRNPN